MSDLNPSAPLNIYLLRCPDTLEVRYVGVTRGTLEHRLGQHCSPRGNSHRDRWIRKLARAGKKPAIELIEVTILGCWEEREQYWIAHYRTLGARLVNSAEGGVGPKGLTLSAETRAKIAAANRGKRHTEEWKAALAERMRGSCHSEEVRAKIGASQRGKVLSEDHRAKLKARKVTWVTPEQLAHMRAAQKPWSDERRRAQSERQKGKKFSEEHRRNIANARRQPRVRVPCANCGQLVERLASRVAGPKAKEQFCGHACAARFSGAKRRRPPVPCRCDWCGTGILRPAGEFDPAKNVFCGRSCAASYGHAHSDRRVVLSCARCGAEMRRPRCRVVKSKSGLQFCDRNCRDAHRIGAPLTMPGRVTVPCGHCGALVAKDRNEVAKSRSGHVFCSRPCAARYRVAAAERASQ